MDKIISSITLNDVFHNWFESTFSLNGIKR